MTSVRLSASLMTRTRSSLSRTRSGSSRLSRTLASVLAGLGIFPSRENERPQSQRGDGDDRDERRLRLHVLPDRSHQRCQGEPPDEADGMQATGDLRQTNPTPELRGKLFALDLAVN